jgi:SAM-dependent methyltransferase
MEPVPLPPRELCEYVGDHGDDVFNSYLGAGHAIRERIVGLLPQDYDFSGKRVLDFGCGSGRALRHFLHQARAGDWHGCDISAECIDWVSAHLSPPVTVHRTNELPPLPFGDREFDLIYATSVFSHLTDSWSAWLLELQRILKADGILIATFMGPGAVEVIANEPWDDGNYGMNVLGYGNPWWANGPMVLISEWWLRAHWGRAFEIEQLENDRFVGIQGVVVMRPRAVAPSVDELEAPEPDEPRELSAARHSIRQLHQENATINAHLLHKDSELRQAHSELSQAQYRLGFYERIPGLSAGRDLYHRVRDALHAQRA